MILKFWAKTACLFLFRSRRSTSVLYLMVFSSVSVLIFLSALAEGVNDAMIRNSVSLFSGHISGFSLSEGLTTNELAVKGVSGVLKRRHVPGILFNNMDFHMVTLVLMDMTQEKQYTAMWKKTVAGRYPEKGENNIFISRSTAERLNAKPGDKIYFATGLESEKVALTVSGLFITGIDTIDREFSFCQFNIFPNKKGPWNAAVFLEDGVDPESVIAVYRDLPDVGNSYFKSWPEQMPDLKQLIDLNYVSMSIVVFVVFGVVSLGIACAFTIFILKNMREYGILKAMGVTPYEITALIFFEVVFMNLAASTIGILFGIAVVELIARTGIDLTAYTSHNQYFAVISLLQCCFFNYLPRITSMVTKSF
jgi:ABC-type lipoprotein release transport system permease subunit